MLWPLIPAHQNAPKTVHPALRAFDNPAPRAFARLLRQFFGFLTTTAHMGGQATFLEEGAHFRIIIAFIQAHAQ